MPVTPLHVGPGVLAKALAPRHFSLTAFILANILMDLEPAFLWLLTGDPAHPYLHTYLGATVVAVVAAAIGHGVGEWLLRWWNEHLSPTQFRWLGTAPLIPRHAFWLGALTGAWSHVWLDSVMHVDVEPWKPFLSGNDWHGAVSLESLEALCILAGGVGALVLARRRFRELHPKLTPMTKAVRSALLALAVPLVGLPWIQYGIVGPNGDVGWSTLELPILAWAVVMLLYAPVLMVGSVLGKNRPSRRISLIRVICYLSGTFGGLWLASGIRDSAFDELAQRSQPLIEAIARYEDQTGLPPRSLDELVPAFLPESPRTGMGAYPSYRYKTYPEQGGPWGENQWRLSVPASSGLLNWDEFLYLPKQDSGRQNLGSHRQSGRWVYIHE